MLQRGAELSRVDGGNPELDKEVSWDEVHEEVRRLEGGCQGCGARRVPQEGGQAFGGGVGFAVQPRLAVLNGPRTGRGHILCPCSRVMAHNLTRTTTDFWQFVGSI